MANGYSFLDELARLQAETDQQRDQAERSAARARRAEFFEGKAVAADLLGRVAVYGRDHQQNADTLRKAAQQQPDTLAGRVAAGELADGAQSYQAEADRQHPQRQADTELFALRERIAREHAARAGAANRDHYERHREPERSTRNGEA